jgi:hypothetical protein
MVACTATQNALCTAYTGIGSWLGVATGNPGSGTSATNEASGGSPAYARQQTTWGSVSGGTVTGTEEIINVPAGLYTYMIMATASTGATMFDNCPINNIPLAGQGQIVLAPNYNQS